MQKNVIVTGGNGFLGRHVVAELRGRGATRVLTPAKAEYDLCYADHVHRLLDDHDPDLVIHLAAAVGGIGANQKNPGRFFYENAVMGLNLLEAARKFEVPKVVTIGTVCSYPKFAKVPFVEDDLWNGYPEETNAPYGLAKKMVMVMCRAYREQYGCDFVHLVMANLYGPGDDFDLETSHTIPALIRKMIAAKESSATEIEVWGTGTPSREFLYAADAAEGIVTAAEQYDSSEPVNLGTGREVTIKELAGMIRAATGFEGEFRWNPERPDGQPRRALDTSRAREAFGFVATTSLEDGLAKTVEWYLANRG